MNGSSPASSGSARALAAWLVLGLLCGLLFFYHLDQRDLWNSHEARAAQDARVIVDDGAWGLPHLYDGRLELQKPPLYYWAVALVSRWRGTPVDAWAVRLPAALCATACVLLLYGTCRRRGRPIAGLVSAAVLATALHFAWIGRVARVDVPLTVAIATSVLGFAQVSSDSERPARYRLIAAYMAIAAALLLKGPIGIVLPTMIVAVHLLVERRLPRLWKCAGLAQRLGLWWGAALVFLLVIPWFCWANHASRGELFRVFFWHHNVERGFGGSDDLRAHPWWFYGPDFLWNFLPWSPVAVAAVWYYSRGGRWQQDADARLGVVWFLTTAVLLSLMRFKRSDYLLPAYPGAALFVGCALERCYLRSDRPRRWAWGFGAVITACVAGWLIYVDRILPAQEAGREYRHFAAAIRQYVPPPEPVLFFRTEAHALAFHVGRPLETFVEWERLDALAARPESSYVVMPATVAAEWRQFVHSGCLVEVLRNTSRAPGHEKPLVLLRTRPARTLEAGEE